jgi:hypothetical protein
VTRIKFRYVYGTLANAEALVSAMEWKSVVEKPIERDNIFGDEFDDEDDDAEDDGYLVDADLWSQLHAA